MFRSRIGQGELDIGSLRLAPGSHSSPREGVCVVELASLLGGETFSDRPRCVCRVIAAYLRALNDRLAHADRQRLRPYATLAVYDRAGHPGTRRRREICMTAVGARPRGGPLRRFLERLAVTTRVLAVLGPGRAIWIDEGVAEYAARLVFAERGTEAAFALLDRLLDIGEAPQAGTNGGSRNGLPLEAAPLANPVQGAAQARVAAAIRQLAGDAKVAQRENGGQGANHNGHADHLAGGDAGQRDEEGVKGDDAGDGDPERDSKLAEELHLLPR